ncbi:MAG: haloacid dehalogenase type II [bacterium]
MKPILALCFDVFGTVVDWRSSIIDEGQQINAQRGLNIDWADFADSWRAMYQPSMEKVRTGQRPWTILDQLHRESLNKLMVEFGLTDWTEQETDGLNRVWHRLHPWPDAREGLNRLKQKFIITTCSNGNVALIVNMAKFSALPWDMVLGAEVTRHYKPQDEAYLESARLLGLVPEQCCMVAAHNNDLVAAGKNGMQTAFVARPTEYGPHQDKDFKAENEYTFVADSFIDLAEQMDCPL